MTSSFIERFLGKIKTSSASDGCWLWTGTINHLGYGKIKYNGNNYSAHRIAWVVFVDNITNVHEGFYGTCVLHRCDVRNCVNPEHLFLGSSLDNIKDMCAKGRGNHSVAVEAAAEIRRRRTHCRKGGHPYSPENMYLDSNGRRACKACRRAYVKEWNRKRAA